MKARFTRIEIIKQCPFCPRFSPLLPRFCCKTRLWDVCGVFWRHS